MTKIGITGHQNIPAIALNYVTDGIRRHLVQIEEPLVGIGSLAVGADQLFVTIIGELGGQSHVVIPCERYETTFHTPAEVDRYRALLASATSSEVLSFAAPSEAAFMAAGSRVVELSDIIVAVWDGKPAAGYGGTADVVTYARTSGREVLIVWPDGVGRT